MVVGMEGEFLDNFIGKKVAIGVPHQYKKQPFFFFGTLLHVKKKQLLLELENQTGFKYIPLEEIVDIHLDKRIGRGDFS
jgi:hypothetical protein